MPPTVASVDEELATVSKRMRSGYHGGERREAEVERADRLLDIRNILTRLAAAKERP